MTCFSNFNISTSYILPAVLRLFHLDSRVRIETAYLALLWENFSHIHVGFIFEFLSDVLLVLESNLTKG
jgi:hypothetical protein